MFLPDSKYRRSKMKTNRISRTKKTLFGFTLLCAMGVSVAGPFPGSVSIHLFPGFPQANAVDFHYFPNANVYFSFSTGQYYYPSHGAWQHSRVLPPRFRIHPRERHWVRGDHRVGSRHHQPRRHHNPRSYGHGDRHGWDHDRRQPERHGDRHRSDRREGGDRHRG